ncbi:MAG: hypothetical protein ACXWDO_06870 [Bacteroidia bacterium]
MRKIILCLALVSICFYSCDNSKTDEKEKEEQQEFQQRPDYSKDTLSA